MYVTISLSFPLANFSHSLTTKLDVVKALDFVMRYMPWNFVLALAVVVFGCYCSRTLMRFPPLPGPIPLISHLIQIEKVCVPYSGVDNKGSTVSTEGDTVVIKANARKRCRV